MANNTNSKPLSVSRIFLNGILINNPILVQVVGICPVAAAAFSLKASALLAAVFSLVLVVSQFIAGVFLRKLPRWIRVAVYLITGLAVVCPVMYLLEKYNAGVRLTVGIYLPLMAASSLAALYCEKVAVRRPVKQSFIISLAVCSGYTAVLLLTGFVRELLGSGTIAGKSVSFIRPASGMLMPFGGFLVLGFAAALLRKFILNHYPEQAEETAFKIVNTSVSVRQKPPARQPAARPAAPFNGGSPESPGTDNAGLNEQE